VLASAPQLLASVRALHFSDAPSDARALAPTIREAWLRLRLAQVRRQQAAHDRADRFGDSHDVFMAWLIESERLNREHAKLARELDDGDRC
jgi:hypothetical protein